MENQSYMDFAAGLQIAAEQILMGYCLARLARPFLAQSREPSEGNLRGFRQGLGYFFMPGKSKRTGNCMTVPQKSRLVWAAYSMTILLLWAMQFYPRSSAATGAGVLAAFLVLCLADRRNYEQKIFLCAAFFSLCWLACAITEIFYDSLYRYASHTAYMAARQELWPALYLVMCLFFLLMEMTIMSLFLKCILKAYTYKSANMSKKELCMLLVPLFTGMGGFEIIHYYRSYYILQTGKNAGQYDIRALFYYAVSMAAVMVTVGLYQSIKGRQEERLQNELLAARIDDIQHHIEQAESLYQSIRSIRHDMTNHLLTLEALYAGNRTEEAREYTADLKAALAGAAGGMGSGNPVTDVILREWKKEAQKRGVDFHSDFYYPAGSDINAFDLSVILNNGLQNAVEYAEGNAPDRPQVSLRSRHRNNAYLIEIRNSFSGSLRWDAQSGLPVTSKEKTEGHGYGLSNIRRVAGKYAGDMVIDVQDGWFLLCVMLMMRK